MTRICFNKLFEIIENKNTEHLTPTTMIMHCYDAMINNDYAMLKSL